MRPRSLWQISVRTVPEYEETVAEFLGDKFKEIPVSWTDSDTGSVTVFIYLSGKPRSPLRLIREMKQPGPLTGGVSLKRVPARDWAESWKRHFKPIEIGRALLVKPSWSRKRPRENQAVVVLDPGLSFGTGQHPTTAFCLKQIASRRRAGDSQSLLDIGTGSGILAIGAAKLGYDVHAIDMDRDAIRISRENARVNRVKVQFSRKDVRTLPFNPTRRYTMVCANLISNLLLEQKRRIVAQLRPDGALAIAGVLDSEFAKVERAYRVEGLRMVTSKREKEWRSGLFVSHE